MSYELASSELAYISNLADFVSFISNECCESGWIFRGQSAASWGLVPGLYRERSQNVVEQKNRNQLEKRLLSQFKREARPYLNIEPGRSGDGGIDLILVLSDAPLAVQVKRRTKPGSVESVEAVRLFLAAMQIRGVTGGLFVTTADHFSRQAHNVAAQAVTLGLVSRFDLIDRHKFFTMIGAIRSDGVPAEWQHHIEYSPW
jgi:hypothetical protein